MEKRWSHIIHVWCMCLKALSQSLVDTTTVILFQMPAWIDLHVIYSYLNVARYLNSSLIWNLLSPQLVLLFKCKTNSSIILYLGYTESKVSLQFQFLNFNIQNETLNMIINLWGLPMFIIFSDLDNYIIDATVSDKADEFACSPWQAAQSISVPSGIFSSSLKM